MIPALDMVLDQLEQIVRAAEDFDGWTVEKDRPEDDDLGRGELPHLNILHRGTSYGLRGPNETLNRADVDLAFTARAEANAPIGPRLRFIEAALFNLLFTNRTLGGYVEDVDPQGSTGGEDQRAEEGKRTLSVTILFVTPVGDQFTLIGASGPITTV